MDFKNGPATFIMPHYLKEDEESRRHLNETVDTVLNQTDPNWKLVIVDDLSPSEDTRNYLNIVKERAPEKINIIFKDTNDGPGYCRNMGVRWAKENGSPFVLFIDADDLADPRRLECVRRIFVEDHEASVVYMTFKVVDENSQIVSWEKLSPSIVEILESHQGNPPQGKNAWIEIGTTKGYTNLTSATAVKTDIAFKFPFPPEKVSEDSHTWMRYSAGGDKFVYCPEAPTLYRIPQNTAGSSSRTREGGRHGFYVQKARVDTEGFMEAVKLAIENGKIKESEKDELCIRFYVKLGETMVKEQFMDIAMEQIRKSVAISKEITEKVVAEKGLGGREWTKIV